MTHPPHSVTLQRARWTLRVAMGGSANVNKVTVAPSVSNDLTIEAWFRFDTPNASGVTQQLFHTSAIEVFLRGGQITTWVPGVGDLAVPTSLFVPDSAWHHYALRCDGVGGWNLFIDGVLKHSRGGTNLSGNRPPATGV